MKIAYVLYEDMIEGEDKVTAIFDYFPSEEDILTVIDDPYYRHNYYVVEKRLIQKELA